MNPASERRERGLLVLADGVQAAFAAGAVAELARRGARWRRGAGAGLGAHVGLLAVLGEPDEAERRWARDGEAGAPMFESRLVAARRALGDATGVALAPDPWTLDGWLDPAGLAEHLAPESAAVPLRLSQRGARFEVAVEDVVSGAAEWADLVATGAVEAGGLVRAAAAFPGGWGPLRVARGGTAHAVWGGVGAALRCPSPWSSDGGGWDVVCGFPVPALARTAIGAALLELIQRRSEASAASGLTRWIAERGRAEVDIVAPGADAWRAFTARADADLGVEYPLPFERNGELERLLVRFGAFSAGLAAGGVSG